MDGGSRRGSRQGMDPIVRRVGFVTPGTEPEIPLQQVVLNGPGQSSPAPVIIPPRPIIASSTLSQEINSKTTAALKTVTVDALKNANIEASRVSEDLTLSSSFGGSDRSGGEAVSEVPASLSTVTTMVRQVSIASASVPAGGFAGPSVGLTPAPIAASVSEKAAIGGVKEKPKTTRAERKAIQEAQRAAKAAAQGGGKAPSVKGSVAGGGDEKKGGGKPAEPKTPKATPRREGSLAGSEKKPPVPAVRMQFDDKDRVAKATKKNIVEQTETKNRVELFRHLPQYVHGSQLPSAEAKFFRVQEPGHPHPAVYQVGLRYLTGDIVGANARCVAMLLAFAEMIRDYSTPPQKTLVRDLTAKINSHVQFLTTCRPHAVSMGNAIKLLKTRILKLPGHFTEAEAKKSLIEDIDKFIQEKIVFADKVIVDHAVEKIREGDVVLTHGHSHVVEKILEAAHARGKNFRVVVVDSRPRLEGKALLRRLLQKGLKCTYTHVNGLCYIMQEVDRVFLGAATVLANGVVVSRAGSAATAMVAHAYSVPVLICCETYKFHERVQLDSICSNELGNPEALVDVPGRKELTELQGWDKNDNLQLLNLTYDAMPADYVAMIITELGLIPPTSVPVILREYRKESNALELL
ncbi:eukaryotic translation initiation factor eIF-2B delta subunit [Klebsormidium nitens]|uniref:Translation initiation factor eIF2B subunit delta n=1 Tax=Klebsormidium nitens TaxID=105231 RepID=A0A1Y1HT83_KLENI|nr:eukaryotic translation initiation factor eIF-2B delta subunit [Klebsormidium nitens]|eukprot:GAQ79038.1 eukaryotic translation initiation factor eIF-2B delta subunit [Klebsormidium nitens]